MMKEKPMLQNAQNNSNQDRQMFAKKMPEKEGQRAYRQAMQELATRLQGELIFPGDPDYESARGVWNGAADRHPALIVRPINVADVITAVNFAREQNLEVAVRSGGHSMPGYSTIDNGMVMDLSNMKSITFDPERRIARIEPGLTWGEVARTLQPYGLALSSGDVATVGVGGLLLGGGIGWMVRKYGLTIDRLRAVELVTANGEFVRASASENAELFWGLRGGGGNFGVATAFEVNLHPAGIVIGGAVFYEAAQAEGIMRAYARYAGAAPNELTTMVTFMAAPPAPFIPPEKQGMPSVAILVCYTGDLAEGERVVAPLRTLGTPIADVIGPMPYPAMFAMTEEASVHGFQHSVRSMFLRTLSNDVIHTIVEQAAVIMTPMTIVQVRVLGGAMSRVAKDATAFAHRDKQVLVMITNFAPASEDAEPSRARTERVWQALRPYADGVYVNFLADEGERRVHDAYPPATYARLAALKKLYDPTNMFHLNQNIPPARTGMLAA
jgi:FAD/FMN-containing dehydrogenase